jgi:hypothetical protein
LFIFSWRFSGRFEPASRKTSKQQHRLLRYHYQEEGRDTWSSGEDTMREGFGVLALCLCAQFVSVRAEAGDQDKSVQEMIQASFTVLLKDSPSEDEVRGALIRLLDAVVLILPQTEQVGDARSNLEAARLELKDRPLLSEKGG